MFVGEDANVFQRPRKIEDGLCVRKVWRLFFWKGNNRHCGKIAEIRLNQKPLPVGDGKS